MCAPAGGAADGLLLALALLAAARPLGGGNMRDPPTPPAALGRVTGPACGAQAGRRPRPYRVCAGRHTQDGGGVSSCLAHADEPLGLLSRGLKLSRPCAETAGAGAEERRRWKHIMGLDWLGLVNQLEAGHIPAWVPGQ
jgi:hypothetical protein